MCIGFWVVLDLVEALIFVSGLVCLVFLEG